MSLADALHSGQLVELFPEYAITYDPLYLYYPSRREHSNVFKLIVDVLRVEVVWNLTPPRPSVINNSYSQTNRNKHEKSW